MDPHALAPYAPYLLFAAVAATLFWLGHVLAQRRAANFLSSGTRAVSLTEAAQTVYDAAKRERLVIVSVAEKSANGPVDWFARSIASVVPVYRAGGVRAQERFAAADGARADITALHIDRKDIRTYLRWARTVQ